MSTYKIRRIEVDFPFEADDCQLVYMEKNHIVSSKRKPKMVIFGSREQLCVHEEVSLLRGKIQNNTCHLICRKREKYQCSHYSRVEGKLYIAHFYDYA
ncbi:hypothetical protein POTOM_011591 [Populus tomentosa]|uniref:RAD3-like helicase DEAD domain-containing protein n=1 Tax=Populus tomentosa TaxID=118781 RepID=A0A8X8D8G5_POPTO|nr:hypothetical protein POTOM_011591 [Populus tomentosa]